MIERRGTRPFISLQRQSASCDAGWSSSAIEAIPSKRKPWNAGLVGLDDDAVVIVDVLVEQRTCNAKVKGSIPLSDTNNAS